MSTVIPEYLDAVPVYLLPEGRGPYRLADYLELPDEPRVELINGRYHLSPSPRPLHQVVSGELHWLLHGIVKQSGGLVLTAPCDVVLFDDTVVQPDLLYFAKDRRPTLESRIESPPDLVIEILSPSHHTRDRVLKAERYAAAGVAEYWIVNPDERSIEFFVLVDGKYQLQSQSSDQPAYQSPRHAELSINLPGFWKEIDRQLNPK